MAGGERWQDWVLRAVALAPGEYERFAGWYFVVEHPMEVRGTYRVMDVCPACDVPPVPFVDFLSPAGLVPYGSAVTACLYPPETVP